MRTFIWDYPPSFVPPLETFEFLLLHNPNPTLGPATIKKQGALILRTFSGIFRKLQLLSCIFGDSLTLFSGQSARTLIGPL